MGVANKPIVPFTQKEKELIKLLESKEMTTYEAQQLGYKIDLSFLLKCDAHKVLIYESDGDIHHKGVKYGIRC